MTAKPILLDTSALLALTEDEVDAAREEQVLRAGAAIIVWTSLLEVVYVTQQERGVPEAERRYALLKVLPVTLQSADGVEVGVQLSCDNSTLHQRGREHTRNR